MFAAVDHVFRNFRHETPSQPPMSRAVRDDEASKQAAQFAAQLLDNYCVQLAERSVLLGQAPQR